MKELDYESKELQTQIRTLNNAYEEKMHDIGGQGQLTRITQSLIELRNDIRSQRLQEGIIMNSLFTHKIKHNDHGKNFLFDGIDEMQEEDI